MEQITKEELKKNPLISGKVVEGKFGGESRYTIIMDSPHAGVEEKYFSMIRFLENRSPFGRDYKGEDGYILKTRDIYTAGETSSYWGSVEQRKGAQIDKFQQLMTNVGNMVKALFQLIRELRILEERLQLYTDADEQHSEPAEVALKDVWVTQVEGGAKNANSVIGLATQVGFVTLPDLFFSVHPKKSSDVEKTVQDVGKEKGISKKVIEVLGRKLKQYLTWKEKTKHELRQGQRFKLKYLRQHYHVIKLYLNWLRPYLKNIKKLQMKGTADEKDIITAFDTAKIEIEFLAIKKTFRTETSLDNQEFLQFINHFPCVKVKIEFVSIPQMAFQEEFQRGPIHRGRTRIIIEGMVVTKEDIEQYKKHLEEEDYELLASVDSSIEALRDDLNKYLEQAGELEQEEEKPKESFFSPFKAITEGFKEMLGVKKGEGPRPYKTEKVNAAILARVDSYLTYFVFKKQHGMVTE